MSWRPAQNLRRFEGRRVAIRTTAGELLRADVICVFDDGTVVYDVVETNQPERYAQGRGGSSAIPAEFILDIGEAPAGGD